MFRPLELIYPPHLNHPPDVDDRVGRAHALRTDARAARRARACGLELCAESQVRRRISQSPRRVARRGRLGAPRCAGRGALHS